MGALRRPTVSGCESATDFGMSSPKMIEKYVMTEATIAIAIASLEAERKGIDIPSRIGLRVSTAMTPPIAEARVTANVTPICIVAKNFSGVSLSLCSIAAFFLPSSINFLIRDFLSVTTAISAAAKKPLMKIKIMIRKILINMENN
jgi:hypothetical protein